MSTVSFAKENTPGEGDLELNDLRSSLDGSVNETLAEMLWPVMRYIVGEAEDKCEEIDLKAEEEMKAAKRKIVHDQCAKINQFYTRKEHMVQTAAKVHHSNKVNECRLANLRIQERLLREVLAETRQDLAKVSADAERYPAILKGLILQALLRLNEQKVLLRCRHEDIKLIESLLPDIRSEQKQLSGYASRITIDQDAFLGPNISGGVKLFAQGGDIFVESTLESHLELVAAQIVPSIRTALFGPNPNRAFFE